MKDVHAFAAMHATLKASHVSGSCCSQVRKEKRWTWCLYLTGNVLLSPGEEEVGKEKQEAQKGEDGKL